VTNPLRTLILPIFRILLVGVLTGLLAFACLRYLMPAPSNTLLTRHADAATTAQFLDALGANKSVPQAYGELLWHYAHGEFGRSWVNQEAIAPMLWHCLVLSVLLVMPGVLLAHVLALLWALLGKANARLPAVLAQLSTASGLLLCALLAQWLLCGPWLKPLLPWLTPFGLTLDSFSGYVLSMVAPSLAMTLAVFGVQHSYYRALLHSDERTRVLLAARALGLLGWRLFLTGLRPVLPGVLSRMGSSMPMQMFGGSVTIELVFGVPGIGRRGLDAAMSADAPVLVAIALISALGLAFCVAAADALTRLLDARLSNPEARLA
jgi:peptide/nickel transport system permease protein